MIEQSQISSILYLVKNVYNEGFQDQMLKVLMKAVAEEKKKKKKSHEFWFWKSIPIKKAVPFGYGPSGIFLSVSFLGNKYLAFFICKWHNPRVKDKSVRFFFPLELLGCFVEWHLLRHFYKQLGTVSTKLSSVEGGGECYAI